MNIVIFSYSFPPRNGPETFCSARFASALAESGHDVHVVTMAHQNAIERTVYDALVSPSVKVTHIPLSDKSGLALFPRLLHRTREREACDFRRCVKVLKGVLDRTESPLLISRSMPEISNMVAWCCRKHARKWIAHFSDPYPWSMGKFRTISERLFAFWGLNWGRRIIRDADIVSLTCGTAKRYFSETYGEIFNRKTVFVTPHIGEPPLTTNKTWKRTKDGIMVVHAGGLNNARGARQILSAVQACNDAGCQMTFLQVGGVEAGVREDFSKVPSADILANCAPDVAMAVVAAADICFIPDLRTSLPYSPFLPSKFVYQVFADAPIVIYTYKDSAMADYSRRFPEAGIVFADVEVADSLVAALRYASCIDRAKIDRTRLRRLFSKRAISDLYAKV